MQHFMNQYFKLLIKYRVCMLIYDNEHACALSCRAHGSGWYMILHPIRYVPNFNSILIESNPHVPWDGMVKHFTSHSVPGSQHVKSILFIPSSYAARWDGMSHSVPCSQHVNPFRSSCPHVPWDNMVEHGTAWYIPKCTKNWSQIETPHNFCYSLYVAQGIRVQNYSIFTVPPKKWPPRSN